jgi:hypothetical protein
VTMRRAVHRLSDRSGQMRFCEINWTSNPAGRREQ